MFACKKHWNISSYQHKCFVSERKKIQKFCARKQHYLGEREHFVRKMQRKFFLRKRKVSRERKSFVREFNIFVQTFSERKQHFLGENKSFVRSTNILHEKMLFRET